jgi:hypothetical protein
MIFLKSIESSTRKMSLDKIQINHTKDNNLSVNLNINCFYIFTDSMPQIVDYPFVEKGPVRKSMFNYDEE